MDYLLFSHGFPSSFSGLCGRVAFCDFIYQFINIVLSAVVRLEVLKRLDWSGL